MRATLTRLDAPGDGQRFQIETFPAYVGRRGGAEVLIRNRWVSLLHCQLDERGGTLFVRDLHSRNGTLVNGCRVSESPLMPGDQLCVGAVVLRVDYQRHSLTPPPEAEYAPASVGG